MTRITFNPKILGGKSVIRGTRMSVDFILELLASRIVDDVYQILTIRKHPK